MAMIIKAEEGGKQEQISTHAWICCLRKQQIYGFLKRKPLLSFFLLVGSLTGLHLSLFFHLYYIQKDLIEIPKGMERTTIQQLEMPTPKHQMNLFLDSTHNHQQELHP